MRDLAKTCEHDEFKGVDIFISSEWPQRVTSDTTDVPVRDLNWIDKCIADTVYALGCHLGRRGIFVP